MLHMFRTSSFAFKNGKKESNDHIRGDSTSIENYSISEHASTAVQLQLTDQGVPEIGQQTKTSS